MKTDSENRPLVSVVTPVYNGAQYLCECMESVLAQTHQNWEHIIVDNCSTDGSLEIARRYAARDSRIRVCQNSQFLRALPNHNAALRQISAASKYCKIVFADDWIFPECLESMVALAEEHPSIGIVSAYVLEGNEITSTGLPYPSSLVGGREICRRHLLDGLYVFGSPNSVLYRSDLVRNRDPFFNESNVHADTEVCFQILKNSDFGFVHQVLTFTRVRPGSRTEKSGELQTNYAGTLQILVRMGSEYLTPAEFQSLLQWHISTYYKFLGKSLLLGERETIDYHRRKLLEAGFGFSRVRLAGGVLATLYRLGLTPMYTLGRIWKTVTKPETIARAGPSEVAPVPVSHPGDTLE
jgi:glycosyltransferase involved in cell wall biosynthesis